MKEFCEGCRFWERTRANEGTLGHCRRRPPVFQFEMFNRSTDAALAARRFASVFPVTREGDWCGEFEKAF